MSDDGIFLITGAVLLFVVVGVWWLFCWRPLTKDTKRK